MIGTNKIFRDSRVSAKFMEEITVLHEYKSALPCCFGGAVGNLWHVLKFSLKGVKAPELCHFGNQQGRLLFCFPFQLQLVGPN